LETVRLSLQNKSDNFQAKAVIEWLKARFILKDFFNCNFRERNRSMRLQMEFNSHRIRNFTKTDMLNRKDAAT